MFLTRQPRICLKFTQKTLLFSQHPSMLFMLSRKTVLEFCPDQTCCCVFQGIISVNCMHPHKAGTIHSVGCQSRGEAAKITELCYLLNF